MSNVKFPTQYWPGRPPLHTLEQHILAPATTVLPQSSADIQPNLCLCVQYDTAVVMYGTSCKYINLTFPFVIPLPFLTIGTHSLVSAPYKVNFSTSVFSNGTVKYDIIACKDWVNRKLQHQHSAITCLHTYPVLCHTSLPSLRSKHYRCLFALPPKLDQQVPNAPHYPVGHRSHHCLLPLPPPSALCQLSFCTTSAGTADTASNMSVCMGILEPQLVCTS